MRISDWSSDVCSSDLSQRLKPLINSAFLMNYTPTVFTYLSDTPEGRRLSKLGGLGLGISDLLASAVLRRMTTPISQLPPDDEGLANLVREMTPSAHPFGTRRAESGVGKEGGRKGGNGTLE